MIHYALRCGGGHEFDGWFKDSASFETQSACGLLDCPFCATTKVERALMAPNVRTRAARPPEAMEVALSPPPPAPPLAVGVPSVLAAPGHAGELAGPVHPPAIPDQVRAVLQRMRAAVEKNCDYVGAGFAETARQIAQGDTPPRPIYGEATPDQEAALEADGIEFARIPWVPRANG